MFYRVRTVVFVGHLLWINERFPDLGPFELGILGSSLHVSTGPLEVKLTLFFATRLMAIIFSCSDKNRADAGESGKKMSR